MTHGIMILRIFHDVISMGIEKTIVEGSLEVKLPTIWRDEKAVSREKSQKRKDQKKRRCRCAKR